MFCKRINFCSGYFPEFITLDNNITYELSNSDDYLKQIANCKSKYNSKYFRDIYYAYKIGKFHEGKIPDHHSCNHADIGMRDRSRKARTMNTTQSLKGSFSRNAEIGTPLREEDQNYDYVDDTKHCRPGNTGTNSKKSSVNSKSHHRT